MVSASELYLVSGVCHERVEAEGDQEPVPQGEAEGDPLEQKVKHRSRR
jgi:hypothetical protein